MAKKILLVDDDEMLRELLFDALSDWGLEVTLANDGNGLCTRRFNVNQQTFPFKTYA